MALILLGGRRSARVRDWCQRVGRVAFFRDALYGAFFSVAGFVLTLPLTIYQGFFREHQYEMATQTFGPWFVEQLVGLAVGTSSLAIAVGVLYVIIRRTGERWWLWGTVGTIALMVLGSSSARSGSTRCSTPTSPWPIPRCATPCCSSRRPTACRSPTSTSSTPRGRPRA